MVISASSRAGNGKRNEDHYGVKHYDDGVLVVLADGMGSTDCAFEAAVLAVESVMENFDVSASVDYALMSAVLAANDSMADACRRRNCKMGCALAVAYVQEAQVTYMSLGNVRIYLQRQGTAECITRDDVYVASNGNSFLTRSVSGKEIAGKVEVREAALAGVSSVSLETDGYYLKEETDDASVVEVVLFGPHGTRGGA